MAVITTLAACSTNPASNGPDGTTDLPSTLDDAIRYALSFIAQLRDGVATGGGALWMTGMMAQFATTTTPTGWLKLNGQLVSRTTYANLFAFATAAGLVSEAAWSSGASGCFSVGDGATTFRVPDLRGRFMRGLDEGAGIDAGRGIGVMQGSANLQHSHGVTDPQHGHSGGTAGAGGHSHSINDPTHFHGSGVLPGSGVNYNGAGGNPAPVYGATAAAATGITVNAVGDHSHAFVTANSYTGISIQNQGGTEARPTNSAYPIYVKY